VGAVLRQVVHDTQSRNRAVRQEAQRWLSNPANLAYWEDFVGLDDGVLSRLLHAVLGP
jgi:hypothetical protein